MNTNKTLPALTDEEYFEGLEASIGFSVANSTEPTPTPLDAHDRYIAHIRAQAPYLEARMLQKEELSTQDEHRKGAFLEFHMRDQIIKTKNDAKRFTLSLPNDDPKTVWYEQNKLARYKQ